MWLLSKIFHETSCFQGRYHLIMYMTVYVVVVVQLCKIVHHSSSVPNRYLRVAETWFTYIYNHLENNGLKKSTKKFCNKLMQWINNKEQHQLLLWRNIYFLIFLKYDQNLSNNAFLRGMWLNMICRFSPASLKAMI